MLVDFDKLLRSSKYQDAYLPAALMPRHRDDLVRLGSQDGGYVVSHATLEHSDFLISCGLGYAWSFDKAFLDYKGGAGQTCLIHGYDPTIDQRTLARLRRRSFWLQYFSSKHRLRSPLRYEQFFDGVCVKHFADWVRPAGYNDADQADMGLIINRAQADGASRILLKMDIEGDEYTCLPPIAAHADVLTGIVCEVHNTELRRTQLLELLDLLMRDFALIHVSANNCNALAADGMPQVLELTLEHRRMRHVPDRPSTHNYPIAGLDFRNKNRAVDYRLNFAS